LGGYAATRIAVPVVLVNAAPIPCIRRNTINMVPEFAKMHSKDEIVKKYIPILKILFTPLRSAILPIGNRKVAMVSRKPVITQLKATACIENSFSIAGRAILIDDIRKVPRNDVMATMARIGDFC